MLKKRALNVRYNMSDLGMIEEGRPFPDGLEMFKKDSSKWILPEKSTLWGVTQLGRKKVKLSSHLAQPGPVCQKQYGLLAHSDKRVGLALMAQNVQQILF